MPAKFADWVEGLLPMWFSAVNNVDWPRREFYMGASINVGLHMHRHKNNARAGFIRVGVDSAGKPENFISGAAKGLQQPATAAPSAF